MAKYEQLQTGRTKGGHELELSKQDGLYIVQTSISGIVIFENDYMDEDEAVKVFNDLNADPAAHLTRPH